MKNEEKKSVKNDMSFYLLAGSLGVGLVGILVYLVYAIFLM